MSPVDETAAQTKLRRLRQTLLELEAQRSRLVDETVDTSSSTSSQVASEASKLEQALKASNEALQNHIRLLTRYNEIKDVGTGLIGMIAEARQQRIVDVMRDFDMDGID